jgi:hypothetical protein
VTLAEVRATRPPITAWCPADRAHTPHEDELHRRVEELNNYIRVLESDPDWELRDRVEALAKEIETDPWAHEPNLALAPASVTRRLREL